MYRFYCFACDLSFERQDERHPCLDCGKEMRGFDPQPVQGTCDNCGEEFTYPKDQGEPLYCDGCLDWLERKEEYRA